MPQERLNNALHSNKSNLVFYFSQLFCMSLYAFLETVDFFLVLDAPFFFLALMLLTKEFFTPSLFFLVLSFFVAAFLGAVFFLGAAFFLVAFAIGYKI